MTSSSQVSSRGWGAFFDFGTGPFFVPVSEVGMDLLDVLGVANL